MIDSAIPGDEISLDVHKATEIAINNGVQTFSEIFIFDNANNKICVKLAKGTRNCYNYFNNVDLLSPQIKLGLGEKGTNVLTFKISEKLKNE